MSRVLAAVDDSAAARPVLEMALALGPVLGGEVDALHVGDEAGQTADGAARALGVELRTLPGDPPTVLLGEASRDDVVAVVVGARDHRGGRRPAGHVAMRLAGALVVPVVVVPPGARPPEQLRRVLVALEGTARRGRGLRRAVELGTARHVEVDVVHVEDEASIPSFSDQVQYESEVYANEFLARCCPGATAAHVRLRIGDPAGEVLSTVQESAPDLLAIGWPQGGGPERGAVAREIVRRSEVPVLLVALDEADA